MSAPAASSRKGRPIAKRACDCCRLRKTQCSFGPDNADVCGKCLAAGVPCTFLQDRRQRGPVSRRLAQFREAVAAGTPAESKHHPSPTSSGPSPDAASPHQSSISSSVAQDHHHGSPSASRASPLPLPLGAISVEHLVPEPLFLKILQDFQDRIYPSLPLVHLPYLRHAVSQRLYQTDGAFQRLCFALCAVTVASVPRKFGQYSQGAYADIAEMVDKACQLVLLSRLSSVASWQNKAIHDYMVVPALLAIATLYAGLNSAAWTYASEAIQFLRTLRLYRKESYAALDPVTAEICKRAFWTLYIIQIHDRMGFVHPHTGLGYDPLHTDWEFLLAVDDHAGQKDTKETIVLAGFVVVNKIFLSVADLLSEVFPGQPPPCVLPLDKLGFGDFANQSLFEHEPEQSSPSRKLRSFLLVQHRLRTILQNLPPLLRPLPQTVRSPTFVTRERHGGLEHESTSDVRAMDGSLRNGYFSRSGTPPDEAEIMAAQMEVSWANIQVTSLFIQSIFLEICISSLQNENGGSATGPAMTMEAASPMSLVSSSSMQQSAASDPGLRTKLQDFRERIARDLLEAVNACSLATLESNGLSMIVKIREIAATMLDAKDAGLTEDKNGGSSSSSSQPDFEAQEKRQWYVQQFVDVLARLDYASQQGSYPAGGSARSPVQSR
ncbi:hypothetical protein Micbo1qcDRAFT_231719 [Microdochium bolleyi]|uniref:Zn(2)-C6 fungal-type domain-containing protein n=1 Tax=Microdochium bolleyi TaxID=196109 RepID=A0A136JAI8_9PEZI|nr:hypothetical protein Micbo1qcDRAFT_231719 [Microdochium bolleyi]